MKKSLLIYLVFCSFVFGQNNFEMLYPKPSDSQNNKITFADGNLGFIINGKRQLLITVDKGVTWEINRTLDFFPREIKFKNNIGIIAGDGAILRSDDYGKNWVKVYQYGFNLNSINFINDNTIYVSGQSTLLKSFDNGLTWNDSSYISGGSAAATVFTDENTGHAACYNGKILKTVDGGQNWYSTINEPGMPSDFYSISFPTKNIGFANKGHGDMLKTTNGGETWVKFSDLIYSREAYGMQFFDDNSGITVGRDGAIYKTQNGGSSWQWISAMPTFTYDSGYDLRSLYFFDPQNGICVGDNGRIIKTENGGANWKNYSPTYDEINEFHLVAPNKGFMKTNKGEFFKMDTNENTLVKLQSPPNQNTQAFFFVNESVGYSIGANQGSVYKTTDGGTHWNLTNNSTNIILYESLYSISFLNENLGYVSGGYNQPGVFRTTNGGVSWEKISNYSFISLKFVDQNVGFGMRAGMNSILYKTIDGGVTWNPCFNNSSWQIIFYALDKDNIFIKSDEGDSSFHKTTDGGSSWVQSNILDYGFDKIKFINNNVGFVADDSNLYNTRRRADMEFSIL